MNLLLIKFSARLWFNSKTSMSAQPEEKNNNYYSELKNPESLSRRVNVNDLVTKMNEDKKKERKNSLILGAAAVSAVTVFGIILTL